MYEIQPNDVCEDCKVSLVNSMYVSKHNVEGDLIHLRCTICHDLSDLREFHDTGILRTNLITWIGQRTYHAERIAESGDSYLDTYRNEWAALYRTALTEDELAIDASEKHLRTLARRFEDTVWWGGLQKHVRAQRTHGGSMDKPVHGLTIMTYAMCARCMITITDVATNESVTLMCTEKTPVWDELSVECFGDLPEGHPRRDPHTMHLRGIDAKAETAYRLIETVINTWPHGYKYRQDGNVSLAIPGLNSGTWKRSRYRQARRGRRM